MTPPVRRSYLANGLNAVRADWNGFAVLHTTAARVGGLDLGLVPGEGGRDVEGILAGCEKREIEVVYLLAADEIDTARLGKAFVIYQGHHGDAGAHRADGGRTHLRYWEPQSACCTRYKCCPATPGTPRRLPSSLRMQDRDRCK